MQYGSMSGRASRPKGYQLLVSGLPPTGSWQDVKDHFREAGDIIFADVFRDGTGVVEFSRQDHARRALRDLDDSKFKSHEVCQQKSVKFVTLLINSLHVNKLSWC
jgi:arginine/serine-rich splicing factor 1/9